jgi:outer membrane receptor protein involved in Fe transport
VFTSVNDLRDEERAVLDQFDVPAWATGLTWRSRHWLGDQHEFLLTLDGRVSEGETNERFRNLGNGFTRLRQAGGQRSEMGAALEHTWHATSTVSLKSSVRLDHARDHSGKERTWDLEGGAPMTDDAFASERDWQGSGRLALQWEPSEEWKLHWSGFTGTRRPTLNELYRPFRVGNDITLANAQLQSERLWGTTLGIDWKPADAWSLRLEGFHHRLDDAIANVTLTEGGGTVQPWGFIPAGGSGRQRRNLEEVTITGLESSLTWRNDDGWMLVAGYLLTDSEVRHSVDQPGLQGRSLAQMPTHQAFATIGYDHGGAFYARLEGRWTGSVFDDDLNVRRLDDYVILNAQLGWRFSSEVACFLSAENLLDEEIEVSKSGSGLIGIGAPRLIQLGLRLDF